MEVENEGWFDWGKRAFKNVAVTTKAIATFTGPEKTFEDQYNQGVDSEKRGDDIEMMLENPHRDHTKDNELKKQQKKHYDDAIEKYKVAYRGTLYIHHIPAFFRLKDLLLKLVDQQKKYIAYSLEEAQRLPAGHTEKSHQDMNAQTEIKSLFKSAITSLEEFIKLAKNPSKYFDDYKEDLSKDLPKALGALSALKYNGLIVDYKDSDAIKTLPLIEPDYKTANLLAQEAYTIDGDNNIHYLHNFVLGYYQYYQDTIKRFGENVETNEMSKEIKTYLRKYITKMEKVVKNNRQVQEQKEAMDILNFLERKSHLLLEKKSSSLESIREEEEEEKEGPGWESSKWGGLGGKSRKCRSIKRRSIKRKSIKRKSKTYKKTRRSYRKTKSYYKK